mmetsp:Transcript_11137/g.30770  ORF Transcript_11137/g.30770 Transcript_11137/m.30770 type:complete len:159 (-) Transcript_11137:84-560(-)
MGQPAANPNSCATCGTLDNLKRCSVCKRVLYCSVQCQKADLQRHRQVCGQSSHSQVPAPHVRERSGARPAEAEARSPAPTGPQCMRCRHPFNGERHFAEVACRSIYENDCTHGPYCGPCVKRMRTFTLPFCLGCSALIQNLDAPAIVPDAEGAFEKLD